jgi:hypothetical protein
MGTKSREVIWGGQIMGAEIHARHAREAAQKAAREADRADAHAWSLRMEGYGGPEQPSPTIGQCLNRAASAPARGGPSGGSALQRRFQLPKRRVARSADRVERVGRRGAHSDCIPLLATVHMIKLIETREITPYKWVHPGEDR